jgi:hypothetical protein
MRQNAANHKTVWLLSVNHQPRSHQQPRLLQQEQADEQALYESALVHC